MNEEDVIKESGDAVASAVLALGTMNDAKDLLMKAESECSVAALKLELLSESVEDNGQILKLMNRMDTYRKVLTLTLDEWPTLKDLEKVLRR